MPIYEYECTKCGKIFDKILMLRECDIEMTHQCKKGGKEYPAKKIVSTFDFNFDKVPRHFRPLKKSQPKSYVPDSIKNRRLEKRA